MGLFDEREGNQYGLIRTSFHDQLHMQFEVCLIEGLEKLFFHNKLFRAFF